MRSAARAGRRGAANAPLRLAPPRGARVLVAGGCGGIGRAVVAAARAAGLRVAVFDLARSLAAQPVPRGVPAYALDAAQPESVAAAYAALRRRWRGIDGLVNLVGFALERVPVAATAPAAWNEVIEGNLRAAFLLCRGALPMMGRGSIVNVASGLALRVLPGFAPYSAAKAGIIALTKALAVENAPAIRANAVAPAAVDTAFLRGGTGRRRTAQHLDVAGYVKTIPLARLARPADVVGPVLFLLGPASAYMTGQVLWVNGGGLTP